MHVAWVELYVFCVHSSCMCICPLDPCLSEAPVIQISPGNLTVFEQGLAFFDCFPDLDTVPHPTVEWSVNGTLLDISNSTKYHVSARTARLFISVVTPSDAGAYSCSLSNIEGTVSSSGAGPLTVVPIPGGVYVHVCACMCPCVFGGAFRCVCTV